MKTAMTTSRADPMACSMNYAESRCSAKPPALWAERQTKIRRMWQGAVRTHATQDGRSRQSRTLDLPSTHNQCALSTQAVRATAEWVVAAPNERVHLFNRTRCLGNRSSARRLAVRHADDEEGSTRCERQAENRHHCCAPAAPAELVMDGGRDPLRRSGVPRSARRVSFGRGLASGVVISGLLIVYDMLYEP